MAEKENKPTGKEEELFLQQLYKALFLSATQFDKNVLLISTGALGLSITFIKDIVCMKCAIYICALHWSWILLIATMFISLLSHFFSTRSMNYEIENLHQPDDKKNNKASITVDVMNISMIITLIVGISLLVFFIVKNI